MGFGTCLAFALCSRFASSIIDDDEDDKICPVTVFFFDLLLSLDGVPLLLLLV